jgi:hypothetical protein
MYVYAPALEVLHSQCSCVHGLTTGLFLGEISTMVSQYSGCLDSRCTSGQESFWPTIVQYFLLQLLLLYIIITIIYCFRYSIVTLSNFTVALSDHFCMLRIPWSFTWVIWIYRKSGHLTI